MSGNNTQKKHSMDSMSFVFLTDLERIQASLFSITKSITGEWQRQEVGVKAKQRVPRTETRQRL